MPEEEVMLDLAELFKVFGDSSRIKILYSLLETEKSVTQLTDELKMTQSAVSHQLRILKANQLVRYRRDGKSLIYALNDEHVSKILQMGLDHISE